MIISVDAENTSDKIQYPFMMNTLNKLGGELLQPDKGYLWKPTANTTHSDERLNTVPVRPGTIQECLFLPILFNTVLKVLARALMREKDIKGMWIGKEEIKLSIHRLSYIERLPKRPLKTTRTNKSCMVETEKINIQKQIVFLYIFNNQSENRTLKKTQKD